MLTTLVDYLGYGKFYPVATSFFSESVFVGLRTCLKLRKFGNLRKYGCTSIAEPDVMRCLDQETWAQDVAPDF